MAKQPAQQGRKKKQTTVTVWNQITRIPVVYLIFLLLAFIIYGQTLQFFLGKFDEDLLILGNLGLLRDLANIKIAFTTDAFLSDKGVSFYRPLQTLSYMIDARFFQERGSVFYFTNILIHAATCSALFYLLTLLENSRKAAFIFTLLFLASPLFVHAIAWAPSRGDLLIGLFGVLSLFFFIKLAATGEYKYGIFTLLAFFAAMFSKETAVFIPLLILLYYLFLDKNKKLTLPTRLLIFAGFLLIMVLYFILRAQVVKLPSPPAEFGLAPLFHNLRTLPEYFAKFFFPVHLAPMSGFTIVNTSLGFIIVIILIIIILYFSAKPYTKELFGLVWFLVFAMPGVMYSHTLGSAAYDYLEHRSYLPMAGIIMLLFFIYNRIPDGKLKERTANYTILFAIILGGYSFFYTRNYENPMIFYNHTIAMNPASALALSNRGLIKADLKDFKGAVADYEQAVAVKHDYAQAYVNKGISLSAMNDKVGAIEQYDTAIKYQPDLFQAHFNKANAKFELGFFEDALEGYNHSIKLYPTFTLAYTSRGAVYFRMQDFASAEKDFTHAIKLDAKNAVAYMNRGKARFNESNKEGACADWQMASGLGNSEAQDLLNKYCNR